MCPTALKLQTWWNAYKRFIRHHVSKLLVHDHRGTHARTAPKQNASGTVLTAVQTQKNNVSGIAEYWRFGAGGCDSERILAVSGRTHQHVAVPTSLEQQTSRILPRTLHEPTATHCALLASNSCCEQSKGHYVLPLSFLFFWQPDALIFSQMAGQRSVKNTSEAGPSLNCTGSQSVKFGSGFRSPIR